MFPKDPQTQRSNLRICSLYILKKENYKFKIKSGGILHKRN